MSSPRATRLSLARTGAVLLLGAALVAPASAPLAAQAAARPTIERFFSIASPLELTAARKADRLAWATYERGMRNVYTAAAPNFTPVRLTRFLQDNGIDVGDVSLSDDGTIAVFVRGSAPNRQGWIANPTHDPAGAERAIWAVRTAGGPAWRVAEGGSPELSPDGRYVAFVKDGQIHRARVLPGATSAKDSGLVPFIKEWGEQSAPRWSPDGSKLAFVSDRDNHAFIGVYDAATRRVEYLAPGVDCDGSPVWSPDGKQIAFVRRPGLPFAQHSQEGSGGIGNPPGAAAGRRRGGCGGFGFGFGRGNQQQQDSSRGNRVPGLYTSTLRGGYTLAIVLADVASCFAAKERPTSGCEGHELWHNAPGDRKFAAINRLMWGDGNLIFPLSPQDDEWDRYYSISVASPAAEPVLLTTTDGFIENATSVALSPDGKTLYYCTNAGDIEKRHIWAVATAGGTPQRVTQGDAIETNPTPLASGRQLAVLAFDAALPASVALVPASGGTAKPFYPRLTAEFPAAAHVTPQVVVVKSPDGLEIHDQLFLPKDLKPGEKRPAMIFVHGGPVRQMLPGYHYMQFYHWAYGFNQWLANQGYVVLSVNYRSGVGYGRSFRFADSTNARGNSEYQDVLAAARWLQTRPEVDPGRIGIWGLSYGGLLTSQALARNSDIFVAGADLAGVHLYGNNLDSTALSYRSSAISAIDSWKSPVFILQGDDDRNVDFAQTVGLVMLLRARNIPYELMVIPDDLHESQLHSRWMETWNRIGGFLHDNVWEKKSASAIGAGSR